jgi:Carboxypeptidase regulatory-like domain/TonB-dependent Receptor Plug Domain
MSKSGVGLSLLLCAYAAWGQGTTSRVLGTVLDATGSAVPDASVKLTNEGTHVTFETRSSDAGAYAFEAVQPGSYQLDVEAGGFRKYTSRANAVSIGQPATINVRLEVGTVVDTVEVTSAVETVQTSSSGNYGNLISGQAVKDLPIVGSRGRNPLDLVVTQPGVVSGANTGGGIHVNGARDRSWNYTLDGIDVNDSSQGGSNTTSFRVNPDMLDEMRVMTGNGTAENGRNSGGQVAMMTRSGTNEIHGDGFWFYRTPRLNANEWQNNLDNLGKAQLQQNIYGGGIGGPVIKNKTFFFFEIQALRARSSAATTRTVYTETARQGILRYVKGGRNQPAGVSGASVDANGNVIGGLSIGTYNVAQNDPQHIGLDPTVLKEIQSEPLPNNFTVGDGLNTAGYVFSAQASERQHDQTIKIDQVINTRNTVYGRLVWGRDDSLCDTVNSGQPVFPGQPCLVNTLRGPRNFAINWRFTPTARMTNEFVVGQNRYDPIFGQPSSLDKISWVGPTSGTPVDNTQQYYFGNSRVVSTWQVVDNFAYMRGSHAFKFGANLRRVREEDTRGSVAGLNANEEINFSSSVNTVDPATFGLPSDLNTAFDRPNFQSSINFLLGRVGQIDRGFVAQGDQWTKSTFNFDTRFPEYEFYAQDTWKAKPNLTVDIGLRYEIRLSPNSPENNLYVPSQPMVAGAAPSNSISWVKGDLFKNQLGNLGPSIGFAWDPFKTGKTSIRANYRIAYDRINTFVIASTILPNLPGAAYAAINTDFGQNGGRLSNLPTLTAPSSSPSTLRTSVAPFSSGSNTVIDPNLKTPRTHEWAFDIQREIARNTAIDISYIGRRAYHLLGAYNVNQAQIYNNGFLDAFNVVKAGGDSPLMDNLLKADSRLNAGETGSQMVRRLYASNLNLNSVGALASSIATRLQNGVSVTQLSTGQPFFFIPYPQFSTVNVLDSNDFSTYNALVAQVNRRLSQGISFNFSYTFSKSLDTRSFDPTLTVVSTGNSSSAGSTPFDINNRRLNYAPSDFDRRHVFQSNFVFELPFGKGKHWLNRGGFVDRALGGWELAGYGRVTSGRPFTVFSGTYTESNVVQSTANCTGCSRGDGSAFTESASGLVWYFDSSERSKFSAPAAGQFGNTGRNYFLSPHYLEMDASILKRVAIGERVKLELRGDATNLTNTPSFAAPTTDITSSTFGRIRNSLSSSSRKIQLGAKVHF